MSPHKYAGHEVVMGDTFCHISLMSWESLSKTDSYRPMASQIRWHELMILVLLMLSFIFEDMALDFMLVSHRFYYIFSLAHLYYYICFARRRAWNYDTSLIIFAKILLHDIILRFRNTIAVNTIDRLSLTFRPFHLSMAPWKAQIRSIFPATSPSPRWPFRMMASLSSAMYNFSFEKVFLILLDRWMIFHSLAASVGRSTMMMPQYIFPHYIDWHYFYIGAHDHWLIWNYNIATGMLLATV